MQITQEMIDRGARAWCPYKTRVCLGDPCQVCRNNAKLILEAALHAAINHARNEERERCAKIAETEYADDRWHGYYRQAGSVIAMRIRNPKED